MLLVTSQRAELDHRNALLEENTSKVNFAIIRVFDGMKIGLGGICALSWLVRRTECTPSE